MSRNLANFDDNVLTIPFRELWRRVKAGAIIGKQVSSNKAKGGFVWFLLPTGVEIRSDVADGMFRLGLIESNGDGLFEGDSQTYRVAGLPKWKNG